jgi:outer membrane protein OmpA-like peptidoglycan-associated protein
MLALLLAAACGPATSRSGLELRHVVLYQNGIGYFEHAGTVPGTRLELGFRRHEIGDVLKTITIVEAGGAAGAALAITALVPKVRPAAPAPGNEAGNEAASDPGSGAGQAEDADRVRLHVALGRAGREVMIAYAVPTPTWQASYRLVLPERGHKRALLQGWAAVNNTSEQDWRAVKLTLATGAPLSFAIDMHTPRYVARPDVTGKLIQPVALGTIKAERALPGDRDGDRVKDDDDLCPDDPEDVDGFQDQDGCPDPDNDGDRIADADDRCPMEPETYNGIDDDDGCPDRGRVIVTDTHIEILDKIYFSRDRADIKPESLPIIDATAATLLGNPDIHAMEVQGHAADNEASAWGLSGQRAAAVRRALVDRGVNTRLVIKPFGPSQPLRTGTSEQARAVNRRVEFLILERADESAPAAAGAVSAPALQRSVRTAVTPRDVAGTVRYELAAPVTIPRGSSALVPIINQEVQGEDVYLYRPDAGAPESSRYPWRAARLENQTPLPLQPGPVAMFARGAFAGEGLIDLLHPGETAFVPYALDSSTTVRIDMDRAEEPVKLVAIARGVATVENREVRVTRYQVQVGAGAPARMFLRHDRAPGFAAVDLPPQTRETDLAYLVPLPLQPGRGSVLEVKEQKPVQRTVRILDSLGAGAGRFSGSGADLGVYVAAGDLPPKLAQKLRDALALRADLARMEEEEDALRTRLGDVSARAQEIRASLQAIGNSGRVAALRRDLLASLKQATEDSERVVRELTVLSVSSAEARARLGEAIRQLSFERGGQAP